MEFKDICRMIEDRGYKVDFENDLRKIAIDEIKKSDVETLVEVLIYLFGYSMMTSKIKESK